MIKTTKPPGGGSDGASNNGHHSPPFMIRSGSVGGVKKASAMLNNNAGPHAPVGEESASLANRTSCGASYRQQHLRHSYGAMVASRLVSDKCRDEVAVLSNPKKRSSSCTTPNGGITADSPPTNVSSTNSSPQHHSHSQRRQDSDCGSSSGLGGMHSKHTDGSSAASAASSASHSSSAAGARGNSHDSGDCSDDLPASTGVAGEGGSDHKSLAATSTLTPSSGTTLAVDPNHHHHSSKYFPANAPFVPSSSGGVEGGVPAVPVFHQPSVITPHPIAALPPALLQSAMAMPAVSHHPLQHLHYMTPAQKPTSWGVPALTQAFIPSAAVAGSGAGGRVPALPTMQPPQQQQQQLQQPPHALYTITCEAAAMAAAAAAAAGHYQVSLGSEPCWSAAAAAATPAATANSMASPAMSAPPPTVTTTGSHGTSDHQQRGGNGNSPLQPAASLSGGAGGDGGGSGGGGDPTSTTSTTGPPTNIPAAIASAINGGHDLFVHIHPGDSITLAVGNEIQHICGPATIRMVSQQSTPPDAIPIDVPPGHVVQQLLDRQGFLSHIIMSQEQQPPAPPSNGIPLSSMAGGMAPQIHATHPSQRLPLKTPSPAPPLMTPPSNTSTARIENTAGSSLPNRPVLKNAGVLHGPSSSLRASTPQHRGGGQLPHRLSPKSNSNSNSPPTQYQPYHQPNSQYGQLHLAQQPQVADAAAYPYIMGGNSAGGASHQHHPSPPTNKGKPWTQLPPSRGFVGRQSPTAFQPIMSKRGPLIKHHPGAIPPSSYYPPAPQGVMLGAAQIMPPYHNGPNVQPPMSGVVGGRGAEVAVVPPPLIGGADYSMAGMEEDDGERLRDMLNRMGQPTVPRVEATEVEVVWQELDTSEAAASGGPFPQIDNSEFVYELFVYERSSQGSRCVVQQKCPSVTTFPRRDHSHHQSANSNGIRVSELRPATDYHACIRASLPERDLHGTFSPHTAFRTLPSRPDPPAMPRLIRREPRMVIVSWRSPLENGAPLVAYMLQLSEGKTEPFETVYEGLSEQSQITQIDPAKFYRIRVIAKNEIGSSEPSPPLSVPPISSTHVVQPHHPRPAPSSCTTPTSRPPPRYQIQPPSIASVTSKSICLSWKTLSDFPYMLVEMSDGPRNIYSPLQPECYAASGSVATVTGVVSNREYRFRLMGTTVSGEVVRSEFIAVRPALYERGGYAHRPPPSATTAPQKQSAPTSMSSESAADATLGVSTPTNLQKVRDDGHTLELKWVGPAVAPSESISYIVEGAKEQESVDASKVGVMKADEAPPSYSAWKICYKGTANSATIHDPLLCLFRVQCVNNMRQIHSSWSDHLFVKRKQSAPTTETATVTAKQQHADGPTEPAQCTAPKFKSITCNSARAIWKQPQQQQAHASCSLIYELQRVDKQPPVIVYSGTEFEHELKGLRAIEHIQARVRAVTIDAEGKRIEGDWSVVGSACTLSAPTSAPLNLRIGHSTTSSASSSAGSSPVHAATASGARKWSDFSVPLQWDPPSQLNGSSISEYLISVTKRPAGTSGDTDAAGSNEQQIGATPKTRFLVEKLAPALRYTFRVCAVNEAGPSEKSNSVEHTTPASAPSVPERLECTPVSDEELRLKWTVPNANGSPITLYRVGIYRMEPSEGEVEEHGAGNDDSSVQRHPHSHHRHHHRQQKYDRELVREELMKTTPDGAGTATTTTTTLVISSLETDTLYEMSVQAENAMGKSAKAKIVCATLPPPPEPPILSLAQAAANLLKLKWNSSLTLACPSSSRERHQTGTTEPGYYYLEKENESGTFSPVYEGELHSAKVRGLKERSVHRFRIRASVSRNVMMGPWSRIYSFSTTRQPPPSIRSAPTINEPQPGVFHLEWVPPVRSQPGGGVQEDDSAASAATTTTNSGSGQWQQLYHYRLQVATKLGIGKSAAEPWKTVYEGPNTSHTLVVDGAVSKMARVMVVLQQSEIGGEEGCGDVLDEESSVSAPSPVSTFSTIKTSTENSPKKRSKQSASGNGSAGCGLSSSNRPGAVSRQPPASAVATPPYSNSNKLGVYRRLRRCITWLKKTITEKDCALIVLLVFVVLAISIAVFLNSYLNTTS